MNYEKSSRPNNKPCLDFLEASFKAMDLKSVQEETAYDTVVEFLQNIKTVVSKSEFGCTCKIEDILPDFSTKLTLHQDKYTAKIPVKEIKDILSKFLVSLQVQKCLKLLMNFLLFKLSSGSSLTTENIMMSIVNFTTVFSSFCPNLEALVGSYLNKLVTLEPNEKFSSLEEQVIMTHLIHFGISEKYRIPIIDFIVSKIDRFEWSVKTNQVTINYITVEPFYNMLMTLYKILDYLSKKNIHEDCERSLICLLKNLQPTLENLKQREEFSFYVRHYINRILLLCNALQTC